MSKGNDKRVSSYLALSASAARLSEQRKDRCLVRAEPSRQPYPIPGSRYVGGYIGVGLEKEDTGKSDT